MTTTKFPQNRPRLRPIPSVIATAELFELDLEEGDLGWDEAMRRLIHKYQHQIAEELSGQRRPEDNLLQVYEGDESRFWKLYREVVAEN
jgi:hypothetical protein